MSKQIEELDRILRDYFWPDDVGESTEFQETHDAAKAEILALKQQWQLEARIALHREVAQNRKRLSYLNELYENDLAQLTQSQNKETKT